MGINKEKKQWPIEQKLSNEVTSDNYYYHKVRRAIIICGTIEKR